MALVYNKFCLRARQWEMRNQGAGLLDSLAFPSHALSFAEQARKLSEARENHKLSTVWTP